MRSREAPGVRPRDFHRPRVVPPRFGWLRLIVSLLLVTLTGSAFGQASDQPPLASSAPGLERVGDLSVTIPAGWERRSAMSEDEGHWQLGDPDAPEAFFAVIRDQPFERFGGMVTVQIEEPGKLAGMSGRRIEGALDTAAGPGRTIVWELKTPNGGLVALVCTAQKDSWKRFEPVFARMLGSVRPSQPDAVTSPLPPQGTPADGTGSSAPVAPPSGARPAYPPVGMRCYVHGRGDYRFLYPATWDIQEKSARGEEDIDFDTLSDPTGRCVVVCSRVRERLADEAAGLARWQAQQEQRFPAAHVSQLLIAGRPAIRVAHFDRSTGMTIFRQSFVAQGCRYAITVYTQSAAGVDRLPDEVTKIFASIELLRDSVALSRWREVRAGPFLLRIPPDWQAGAVDPAHGLEASFESGVEARLTLEKSTNRGGFTVMHSPLLITEELRVGGRSATAYLGSLPNNGGTRMAVVLDWPEPDGSSYCLACYVVARKWANYETTFRHILTTARCDAGPDEVSDAKPRPVGLLMRFPHTDTFKGDTVYSVVAYANGAVISDNRTGRTQTVWIDDHRWQPYTVFEDALQQRPDVARRLNPAISRCVPVFEDQIRVQLFEGGIIVGETATRAIWWGTHRSRSRR